MDVGRWKFVWWLIYYFLLYLAFVAGDKPHGCDICLKKFALACNLRAHMKTHEGMFFIGKITRKSFNTILVVKGLFSISISCFATRNSTKNIEFHVFNTQQSVKAGEKEEILNHISRLIEF